MTDVSSYRAKSVIRVVYESDAVPAGGTTVRSGFQKALAKARDLVPRRSEIEAKERRDAATAATREHSVSIEAKRMMQEAILVKLERGERLTEEEFATL